MTLFFFVLSLAMFAIRAHMSLNDGDVTKVVLYGVWVALAGFWMILCIIAPGAWMVYPGAWIHPGGIGANKK